jgi:hypothetical protein
MANLDDRLAALAAIQPEPALAGLEEQVWTKVQQRKAAAAAGSVSVRVAVTVLALAGGLAFGALHQPPRPAHLAELGVLSEDGLLAPSVRLGGGA